MTMRHSFPGRLKARQPSNSLPAHAGNASASLGCRRTLGSLAGTPSSDTLRLFAEVRAPSLMDSTAYVHLS
eukprot:15439174-Alexandrium_andersonii.AAC.1